MTDPRLSFVDSVTSGNATELLDVLGGTIVRIEITPAALATLPGQVLLYQLATLVARLFDRIELPAGEEPVAHSRLPLINGPFLPGLRSLLTTLRPITEQPENGRIVRVAIGDGAGDDSGADLFVGAIDWVALLSTSRSQPVRESNNPCGALTAGALAAGEVFKLAFDGRIPGALRATDINLSVLTYSPVLGNSLQQQPPLPESIDIDAALVGCGSVGCAFLLGILFTPSLSGHLVTIDNGVFEARNPYKYALLDWATAQTAIPKAVWTRGQVVAHTPSTLSTRAFVGTAHQYVSSLPVEYRIRVAVSAVDTMEARLEIQDTLPCTVVNAGISGSLVEVSSHNFGDGPCLGCLVMGEVMEWWNAEPIATRIALRPERVHELIRTNSGMTQEDVNEIIAAGKIPIDLVVELSGFVGQPLLSFVNRMPYAEASVSAGETGVRARVATAFVSAFAGALLFSEFLKASVPTLAAYRVTNSYRQDLLGVPADGLFRYERDPNGWCSCYSPFRTEVYRKKYGGVC